jgi:glycosyltransferase involved in cell wall biosynthesis
MKYEKISIIIPAYNRAKLIKKTIDSLINQSLLKDNYEIIVADNNSSDNIKEVVEKIIRDNVELKIRYVLEPRQGVHFARNTGAKAAENEILYFTDDDMEADKNLLEELLKLFNMNEKLGTATGLVLPKFEIEPPLWIKKYCQNAILSITEKKEKNLIFSQKDVGVFSCHQAIKKDVLFKAGGFDPENVKGSWVGSGETSLNHYIENLGYEFGYTSKSIIYHLIPKERLTQKYINKRLANQGSADSYSSFKEKMPSKIKLVLRIAEYILKGFYFLGKTFLFLISGNDQWHLRWAWTFYWLARIKYDFKLIADKNWRKLVLKTNWINE